MNLMVTAQNGQTMTSREIAELVESRHDDVKRSIKRLADRGVIGLPPLADYLDNLGRTLRGSRRRASPGLLASGLNTRFRGSYEQMV